jgi:16S rRNA (guanine966-N2)-methyltransferase
MRRSAGGGRTKIRISAGKWKGRLLEVPPSARPTSSRAREALFDLLGDRLAGARVLDLFAGSGAVGLEAVSRGAARAVLVDSDADALRKNVERLGAGEAEVSIAAGDVGAFLDRLASRAEAFDFVFCDPPYAGRFAERLADRLSGVLAPRGTIVLQRDAGDPPPSAGRLVTRSRRAYGRNVFYFLEAAAAAGGL